jgi:hypothetical protein
MHAPARYCRLVVLVKKGETNQKRISSGSSPKSTLTKGY